MLPVSTTQPVRFTPQGCEGENAPVYLIEVPSVLTRPLFYRTLAERGIYLPADADIRAAVEDGIRELVSDHQQAELLAVSAAYWEAAARDAADVPEEVQLPYQDMVKQLSPELPRLRKLDAARTYYLSMLPVVAFECFVKGAENPPAPFRLAGGAVSLQTLTSLPPDHVTQAGWKAVSLLSLSREQEKNSASPSPSPSSPGTSAAAPNRKSKATSGTSSATATPPTQDSA